MVRGLAFGRFVGGGYCGDGFERLGKCRWVVGGWLVPWLVPWLVMMSGGEQGSSCWSHFGTALLWCLSPRGKRNICVELISVLCTDFERCLS